jgi:predicted GIY-YIG superfamily endonuclease
MAAARPAPRAIILIDGEDGSISSSSSSSVIICSSSGTGGGGVGNRLSPVSNDVGVASTDAADDLVLVPSVGQWDGVSDKSNALSSSLVVQNRLQQTHRQHHFNPHDRVSITLQARIDINDTSTSSPNSSSSSGIPSPWKMTPDSAESLPTDRPPSIIHTASPMDNVDEVVVPLSSREKPIPITTNTKPTSEQFLTNNNATICNEDEMSSVSECTGLAKKSSSSLSKRREGYNSRRNGWNRKRGLSTPTPKGNNDDATSVSTSSSMIAVSKSSNIDDDDIASKHFHCYLLRSLDPDHPLKTYIGFTTNPERRIRQHNGILKNGGARRTKRSGRPWTFVCVIHGFEDKITALQFEWAWQNVDKSKAFREALGGDDKLAKKMKRSIGPKARLEELRILLKECLPFCLYSLTVYFPERYYHDIFSGILRRGKNGNPYKKDDDESDALFEPLLAIEVCSLENMPVAREAAQLKEKKKARQEAKKSMKQQKKSVITNESEILDWLGEKDNSWSDLLDDDDADGCDDADHDDEDSFLETITENDVSVALSDGNMESDSVSAVSLMEYLPSNRMDDLSREFFTLSVESCKNRAPVRERMLEYATECDFSTMSSADRSSSLEDEANVTGTDQLSASIDRENQHNNHRTSDYAKMKASTHRRAVDIELDRDVIDLCDSPL